MSVALISLSAGDSSSLRFTLGALSQQGLGVSSVFEPGAASQQRELGGPSIPLVFDVWPEVEGAGYFLNRCVETALAAVPTTSRVLVLSKFKSGERPDETVHFPSRSADGCSVTLGLSNVDNAIASQTQLLGLFRENWHNLPTSGGEGYLLFDTNAWKGVDFREDVGGWGVELHFALASVASRGKVRLVALAETAPADAVDRENERVVSGLVAFAEHTRWRETLFGAGNLLIRSFAWGRPLHSLRAAARRLSDATETMRSRAFLQSDR